MHDAVLPGSASSPSCAVPVLATSISDRPSGFFAVPAHAARTGKPSLGGSAAVFDRALVAGYMRRCLFHIICPPESSATLPLLGLPCSNCFPLASRTAVEIGSLRFPDSLFAENPIVIYY